MKRDKWLNHQFSSGSYAGDDYLKFQRDCKSDLNKMAKDNGLTLHKFMKNHYCFSAVLKTEDDKFIYVSHSDVRHKLLNSDQILVRTMKHDEDWTGGFNNFCKWNNIGEFAKKLAKTI